MAKTIGILVAEDFTYDSEAELHAKLEELKKTMLKTAESGDAILATATAYNIVHINRELAIINAIKDRQSRMPRIHMRIRTLVIEALQGSKDTKSTLKKILDELN